MFLSDKSSNSNKTQIQFYIFKVISLFIEKCLIRQIEYYYILLNNRVSTKTMSFYNKAFTPLQKNNLFRKRTILQLSDYILLRQILFDGRLINRHHKMFAEPLSLNDKNVKSSLVNLIIAVKCQHLGTLNCIQFYFRSENCGII